jgi:ribulose 1,5-bisphosphate carboxylase large subunit-like protein
MNEESIEEKCSETIKGLIDKYKDDEYMIQRVYNHIVNYLPNTLDNEFKNHEKRVNRNNYLTNEQQIFIQVFLSKNKYFYLQNNNFFYAVLF